MDHVALNPKEADESLEPVTDVPAEWPSFRSTLRATRFRFRVFGGVRVIGLGFRFRV